MAQAQEQSSSLIRHLISTQKTGRVAPRTLQLQQGIESLFGRAAEKIGKEKIVLNAPVRAVVPSVDSCRVLTDAGEYRTEKLYLTLPAYALHPLLEGDLPELSERLALIDYTPVVVAHLKISRKENFPFDGFGILLPPVENRRLLGVLWNSSVFPQLYRDQKNHYLTVFAGGAYRRDLAGFDDTVIIKMIREEVIDLFDLQGEPAVVHFRKQVRAIPQYHLGYHKILDGLKEASVKYPPLRFAGNYVGGVSMPKTVAHAMSLVA
jgi:oxygen-dependent protoporphyrinogen oxidase